MTSQKQEASMQDLLLAWLEDTRGGTAKDFERWLKKKKIPFSSIHIAAQLTVLIGADKISIVAPFGKYCFTRG